MTEAKWGPRVLGLDLSLSGTGIARVSAQGVELLCTVRPRKGVVGHERLDLILDAIEDARRGDEIDLIVIEGPSYGSQAGQRGHHERGGLWWLVAHSLYRQKQPYAVVAPRARAQYATGNGGGDKAAVKAAARERYGHLAAIRNDNEADALVIAMMGVEHLGGDVVAVPPANRKPLANVAWPATPADD